MFSLSKFLLGKKYIENKIESCACHCFALCKVYATRGVFDVTQSVDFPWKWSQQQNKKRKAFYFFLFGLTTSMEGLSASWIDYSATEPIITSFFLLRCSLIRYLKHFMKPNTIKCHNLIIRNINYWTETITLLSLEGVKNNPGSWYLLNWWWLIFAAGIYSIQEHQDAHFLSLTFSKLDSIFAITLMPMPVLGFF